MKKMSLNEAVAPLRDYARAHVTEPLILTTRGKPVAALIHLSDADWESVCIGMNPQFISLIERSRKRAEREGTIPLAVVKCELGISDKSPAEKKEL